MPPLSSTTAAVGACTALAEHDFIISTHRGHGHCIAKGADMEAMLAELMGRETGISKGRGGSMHMFNPEIGLLGSNGIVGGGTPSALVLLALLPTGLNQALRAFAFSPAPSQPTERRESPLRIDFLWP